MEAGAEFWLVATRVWRGPGPQIRAPGAISVDLGRDHTAARRDMQIETPKTAKIK